MNVSRDTQELIVSALLKSSHLFASIKNDINEGYFSDPSCKVIYKSLANYYHKYSAMPGLNEMIVSIDDCYSPMSGVNLSEVKDTCQRLFTYEEPEESFIKDKITDFIRKVRSSSALKNFLDQMKINPNLESDEIVSELSKALEVQFSTTKVFNMNDMEGLKEIRKSSVGSSDKSKIVHSFIESVNKCLMFGGYQPTTVNMIVGCPGSGKSMFLINEGVNAIKQGFDVLHIFIGDMVEYDGFIRYLSCISGTPQNSLVMLNEEKQAEVVNICNQQYNNIFDKLFLLAYPSLSIDVNKLIEDISKFEKQLNKDFGVIIIDYPDNLIQEGRSLYEDGGTLYSSLERLARLSQSVVLTASQPSKGYWSHEIIPLEGAAESSKKQQCVDIMLTMSLKSRGANFGSFHLAKARKGETGRVIRFKTDYVKCKIEEIDESTYQAMVSAYGMIKTK